VPGSVDATFGADIPAVLPDAVTLGVIVVEPAVAVAADPIAIPPPS
jgi:hypothetical protein